MTHDATPSPEETRRDFLDRAIFGGLALCAGGMAIPSFLYLMPAGSRGPTSLPVDAGTADSLPEGTARMIQSEGRPILVVAQPQGRFRAFSAICTHLGCVVRWDDATRRILCPCHDGVFGADGSVVSGPPPRPLREYKVVRVGNGLQVQP